MENRKHKIKYNQEIAETFSVIGYIPDDAKVACHYTMRSCSLQQLCLKILTFFKLIEPFNNSVINVGKLILNFRA